jgi:hypothetical protein
VPAIDEYVPGYKAISWVGIALRRICRRRSSAAFADPTFEPRSPILAPSRSQVRFGNF